VSDQAARPIDVSILVNTFRRPRHLAVVLESIAQQQAATTWEVIVSDDGSYDGTEELVAGFAATAGFPVRFTSQPHDGFRLARVRNEAARLARGGYLLFLDGDCILPRHHLASHLDRRRQGTALVGYCARLTEDASRELAPETLSRIDLPGLVTTDERRSLARRRRKAWWHNALRHPTKPRLTGGDFGVWRDDFVAINGFDERFVGWGQEDDDLGLRLRARGVRLESILDRTCSLHVWHPTDPTAAARWRDGPNVAYFARRGRLTACRRGLIERPVSTVVWGLPHDLGSGTLDAALARHLSTAPQVAAGAACEIDVVTRPGRAVFARPAQCRLALIAAGFEPDAALRHAADQIVTIPDEPSLVEALSAAG